MKVRKKSANYYLDSIYFQIFGNEMLTILNMVFLPGFYFHASKETFIFYTLLLLRKKKITF